MDLRYFKVIGQWGYFGSQTVDTDHVYPNVIQLYTSYAINATLAHKGFVVVASSNATDIHFTISKVQGISASTQTPGVYTINIGKEQ